MAPQVQTAQRRPSLFGHFGHPAPMVRDEYGPFCFRFVPVNLGLARRAIGAGYSILSPYHADLQKRTKDYARVTDSLKEPAT
jgi:hypothetical protein